MPKYTFKVTRVRHVVEQAYVDISADSEEAARELACEADPESWDTDDAETGDRTERLVGSYVERLKVQRDEEDEEESDDGY